MKTAAQAVAEWNRVLARNARLLGGTHTVEDRAEIEAWLNGRSLLGIVAQMREALPPHSERTD